MIIAARGEGEERAGTQEIVDAEQQVGGDDQHQREQEVDAADHHELTGHQPSRRGVDDDDNGGIKTRSQGEVRQKRQPAEEAAGVAPEGEPFEREEGCAHRAADQRANGRRSVLDIAVDGADQDGDDDNPDEAAKRGRMQHGPRL